MTLSDKESVEQGKDLIQAYYSVNEYGESYALEKRSQVSEPYHDWAKIAKRFAEIRGGENINSVSGRQIAGDAVLRTVEKLLEDTKATLEALEKQTDQPGNKKLIAQWRWLLNALQGAPHKSGLIPGLKEAGPGSY